MGALAQTTRRIALSKNAIETEGFATQRDTYDQTKDGDDARCDDRAESDLILEELEHPEEFQP